MYDNIKVTKELVSLILAAHENFGEEENDLPLEQQVDHIIKLFNDNTEVY